MTSVTLYRAADGRLSGFECRGHAGYAQAGSDIVCAAVSASTELVITILEQFGLDLRLDIHEENACVRCELADISGEKAQSAKHVLDGYSSYLTAVSQEYPHNLKCRMISE